MVAGSVNLLIGCLIAIQAMVIEKVALSIIVGIFAYGFSIVLYVTSAQNIGATSSQILFSNALIWGLCCRICLFTNPSNGFISFQLSC